MYVFKIVHYCTYYFYCNTGWYEGGGGCSLNQVNKFKVYARSDKLCIRYSKVSFL